MQPYFVCLQAARLEFISVCCSLNWAKVLHVEHIFTGYRGCQDLLPQISFVAIVNAYLSPIGDAYFSIRSLRIISSFLFYDYLREIYPSGSETTITCWSNTMEEYESEKLFIIAPYVCNLMSVTMYNIWFFCISIICLLSLTICCQVILLTGLFDPTMTVGKWSIHCWLFVLIIFLFICINGCLL